VAVYQGGKHLGGEKDTFTPAFSSGLGGGFRTTHFGEVAGAGKEMTWGGEGGVTDYFGGGRSEIGKGNT